MSEDTTGVFSGLSLGLTKPIQCMPAVNECASIVIYDLSTHLLLQQVRERSKARCRHEGIMRSVGTEGN